MLHDESVDDHFDVQPGVPNQIREVQNEWTGTKIVGNNINALTAMGFKRKRGGEQNAEEVGTQERGKVTTREVEEEEEQDVPEVLPQLACKAAVKRARMASSAARACAGAAATAHAVLANPTSSWRHFYVRAAVLRGEAKNTKSERTPRA
jgi:hypothetical protein